MHYHPEKIPKLCNEHPTFHDKCPEHHPCFCKKNYAKRVDRHSDSCYGQHLYQPEPDFCYNEKVAHKSRAKKTKCGCSAKGPHTHEKIVDQVHKLGPNCFLDCKKKPIRRQSSEGKGKRKPCSEEGKSDRDELKRKLQECIKRFNEGSPDTIHKLEVLRDFLNNKIIDEECFPKAEWPHCPVKEGPEAYEVPHPYLPRMTMWAKPQTKRNVLKVTVDGRLGEQYRPKKFYHEEPPLNVPPWVLPRYKSQELRGGKLYSGCKCWRKNGIQDDCERWDCAGRPECRERPWPICPPSMNPPICGVRKPNLYHGKPPTCAKQKPPPPYPEPDIYSIAHIPPPFAPAIPCPLSDENL